jgi:ABC-type multidrug transport system fused ATPase/permease subunit
MNDYKRLFRFLKPQAGLFTVASLFMLLSALFDGLSLAMLLPLADKVLTNKRIVLPAHVPQFLVDLVDRINSLPALVLLDYLAVAIVALFVLKGVVLFLQGYLMNDVSQRVVTDLRCRLYAKMQNLSLDYFSHRRGGELMSRITSDVIQIGNAISSGLVDLIYQTLQVVVFAEPFGSAAAGSYDDVFSPRLAFPTEVPVCNAHSPSAFDDDACRRRQLHELKPRHLCEMHIHVVESDSGIFRSHMPNGAADKVYVVLAAFVGYLADLGVVFSVDGRRGAETRVKGIGIVDKRLRLVHAHIVRYVAAYFGGE